MKKDHHRTIQQIKLLTKHNWMCMHNIHIIIKLYNFSIHIKKKKKTFYYFNTFRIIIIIRIKHISLNT